MQAGLLRRAGGTDEPFFQAGDVELFADGFEAFADTTALNTFGSVWPHGYFTAGEENHALVTSGAHGGSKAFRMTFPFQTTYADTGGHLEIDPITGYPATCSFAIVECWIRTIPGYPWKRIGASDQDGAGEKTLIWSSEAGIDGSGARAVLGGGNRPSGTFWGGAYDSAFPASGTGFGLSLDTTGGTAWCFQNKNATTMNPALAADGSWHRWKIRTVQATTRNSAAVTGDGSVEMWVDGIKVIEYFGANAARPEFGGIPLATTIDGLMRDVAMCGPFNGGPSPAQGDQWKEYDDLRVWMRP